MESEGVQRKGDADTARREGVKRRGKRRKGRSSVPSRVARHRPDVERVTDPLPDYLNYCDEGCDLYPSCLRCPLPHCRHDCRAEGRRPVTRLRDEQLLRQRKLAGKSIAELARTFGVSKRTVQRAIRRSSHE